MKKFLIFFLLLGLPMCNTLFAVPLIDSDAMKKIIETVNDTVNVQNIIDKGQELAICEKSGGQIINEKCFCDSERGLKQKNDSECECQDREYEYRKNEVNCVKKTVPEKNDKLIGENSCIAGTVMDPKSKAVSDAQISITIGGELSTEDGESVKTDVNGNFKLCGPNVGDLGISSSHDLSVRKKGYSSYIAHYDVDNIRDYINTDKMGYGLNVYINPWFLERNVTISAYFSDIPDCKISNGIFMVGSYKDPMNSMDGCKTEGYFSLETESDDNWHLDCFYPGITITYPRIKPIKGPDSSSGIVYLQHPGLFGEKQTRGKNGTNYTLGVKPANVDDYADYNLGGGPLRGFDSGLLKYVLDIQVDTGQITQAEADEYWNKALKNCPEKRTNTGSKNMNTKDVTEAKAREQSLANRTLSAASIAATGIGTMEFAQGLAERRADEAAERDMDAYMATMHCSYGGGKNVPAGDASIELPGGNDSELMKMRGEFFALAEKLKKIKGALGLKPGIESEVVLDRSQTGLYNNESIGVTRGGYTSLYRAKTGSEIDAAKIAEEKETTSKRVKGGAIAAGAGVIGGAIGNIAINGSDNTYGAE